MVVDTTLINRFALLDTWSEKVSTAYCSACQEKGTDVATKKPTELFPDEPKRNSPFGNNAVVVGSAPVVNHCEELWDGIQAAMDVGCGVMLGNTRDGGALCLTVFDGQDRHKTYMTDAEQVRRAGLAMRDVYK